jgi:hypothetical protein
VTDKVRAAAVYAHELREEPADLLAFSMQGELAEALSLEGIAAAGRGASYVPVTELSLLARGLWPEARLSWSLGPDGAWFTEGRRLLGGRGSARFWFDAQSRLSIEPRLYAALSDAGGNRVAFQTTLRFVHGRHGGTLFSVDFGTGRLPEAQPLPTWNEDEPNRWHLQGGVGVRHWLGPDYGLLAVGHGLNQVGNYFTAGGELGLFVEL